MRQSDEEKRGKGKDNRGDDIKSNEEMLDIIKVCYTKYIRIKVNDPCSLKTRGWYHIENSQQCNRFTA